MGSGSAVSAEEDVRNLFSGEIKPAGLSEGERREGEREEERKQEGNHQSVFFCLIAARTPSSIQFMEFF